MASLIAMLLGGAAPGEASAGRPLLTDDARTVGARTAQLETWVRADRELVEQELMAGFAPWEALEVQLAGVHGVERRDRGYGAAVKLLQAKIVPRPVEAGPGFGLGLGAHPPGGRGPLRNPGWRPYGYGMLGWARGDGALAVHASAGLHRGAASTVPTWGLAAEARLGERWEAVAELVSSDPAADREGGSAQLGGRFLAGERVTLDATAGAGLWGEPEAPWITVGLRVELGPF